MSIPAGIGRGRAREGTEELRGEAMRVGARGIEARDGESWPAQRRRWGSARLVDSARGRDGKKGEEKSWRCWRLREREGETCRTWSASQLGARRWPHACNRVASCCCCHGRTEPRFRVHGRQRQQVEPSFLPKSHCNVSIDQYKS